MEIGLKEVMEQGSNLTLFTVTQNDFTNHYIMGQLSVEELMQQFKEVEHPFVDMDGKMIGIEYYAMLEQSDKVSLSVTANMDEDILKIYEINGILEENRTDNNNIHIWQTGLAEYIDLQHRYRYPVEITEEALKALHRFQTSEYPLNQFQEENEMPESFIIWSDSEKNPSEFVLYNPISEKYSHVIPSKDVMEVSDTIRMAEQYMTKEQIGRFDSVRLGLPDKDAERGKEKDFKEITLKFGKGCVGDEFKGRDGTAYRQILVPNVDKNDSRPWQTFVVKANAVHKNKFGKGVWIKLPADGHTTLKRSVVVGKKPDGKKEWGVEENRVSNADLKKMMESYKEKSKPSLTGKLVNKNAEAKQENSSKQQGKDIKEKDTKKALA